MEPEGQPPTRYTTMEDCPSVDEMQDPPSREKVNCRPTLRVSTAASESDLPVLPETKRVNASRAIFTFEEVQDYHEEPSTTIYFCDTPEEDEYSTLSSNSVPHLKKSYAFVDRTFSEGDEEYDIDFDSEKTPIDETVPLQTITTRSPPMPNVKPSSPGYSLCLGFLVGCFIQSSSLGANYVLTVLFGQEFDKLREHHEQIVIFSLIWSLATSTMGVLVVLFLRSLLQAVPDGSGQPCMNLWQVEYSFAFGALGGVCVAWTGTDILLGFRAHAMHSLLTLLFAIAAKIFMLWTNPYGADRILIDDDAEALDGDTSSLDNSYYLPLVEKPAETPIWRMLHSHFRIHGTVLGVLIGFFIQMSSLGASFLLDTFVGSDESGHIQLTPDSLLAFSLSWSFVFGTMGVMILLILRRLLKMVCSDISTKLADKLGLMLEFYFAVGCLVGVNLAWVLTDLGLGLQAHVMRSLLTLAAAAVWCRVLACCFFSGSSMEDTDDDVSQEDELAPVTPVAFASRQQPVEVYEGIMVV